MGVSCTADLGSGPVHAGRLPLALVRGVSFSWICRGRGQFVDSDEAPFGKVIKAVDQTMREYSRGAWPAARR